MSTDQNPEVTILTFAGHNLRSIEIDGERSDFQGCAHVARHRPFTFRQFNDFGVI